MKFVQILTVLCRTKDNRKLDSPASNDIAMLALLNTVKLVVLRMKENSFHLTYFLSPSLVPFSMSPSTSNGLQWPPAATWPSSSELPSLPIPTFSLLIASATVVLQ